MTHRIPEGRNHTIWTAQRAIVQVLERHKLGRATVEAAVLGPHTLAIPVRFHAPTAEASARLLKLAPVFSQVLHREARVYLDHRRGLHVIEVPTPWPHTIKQADCPSGSGLKIVLGVDPFLDPVTLDMGARPHLLVVGPTSSGKSTAVRTILSALVAQNPPGKLGIIIASFRIEDWDAVRAAPHVWDVVNSTRDLERLGAYMARLAETRPRGALPELFWVLDDSLNLFSVARDLPARVLQVSALGRHAGIHLIVSSQAATAEGVGSATVARNLSHPRLVLGAMSAQEAAIAAGRAGTGAETIGTYPGDCLLIGERRQERVAIALPDPYRGKLTRAPLRPWCALPEASPPPLSEEEDSYAPVRAPLSAGGAPSEETLRRLYRSWQDAGGSVENGHILRYSAAYRAAGVTKSGSHAGWLRLAIERYGK